MELLPRTGCWRPVYESSAGMYANSLAGLVCGHGQCIRCTCFFCGFLCQSSALSSAYSHATAAKAPSTPAAAVNSHAGEENVPSELAPVSSVSSRSSMAVCLECLLLILLRILVYIPMLEQIMLQVCSFLFLLCTCTGMTHE